MDILLEQIRHLRPQFFGQKTERIQSDPAANIVPCDVMKKIIWVVPLLFGLILNWSMVFAADVYVESSGLCGKKTPCYSTIQAAINTANSGDIIKLAQGSYAETFVLDTDKKLIFQGGWDEGFTTQTPRTTAIRAPVVKKGAIAFQELRIAEIENPITVKNGFSEFYFCSDPDIQVSPGNIAATYLEPVDAVKSNLPDTDGLGMDFIPIKINESRWLKYSLDTRDNTIQSAVMIDSGLVEIFRLNRDSSEITAYIPQGSYTISVRSGYTVKESGGADHRVVFLCPDMGFRDLTPALGAFKQIIRVNSAPWGNLQEINLPYANLANADLYYSDLRGANLHAASLEEANLEGADMAEIILQAANMTNINLANASMPDANLYAANIKNGNLISADLSEANLFSANMESVNLMGACLDSAYLYAANLSYGNLEGATLRDANLGVAYLHRANLHNADLSRANLGDADLSYSVLRNAILHGANIEGADFTGADTTGVVW